MPASTVMNSQDRPVPDSNQSSVGKRRSGRPAKGNTHLQTMLVEFAWSAIHHNG
jgi:hypothetical protein